MKRLVKIVLMSSLLLCIGLLNLAISQDRNSAKSSLATNVIPPTEQMKSTLENLQAAYADELNARAQYTEYAKKADEEGYHQVASMFRAVARAEEVHAENYASLIKLKGNVPNVETIAPAAKSTRENLEAAVASEDFNKDVRYPSYIRQAKKERNKSAEQAFNYSRVAESEHAVVYDQALNDLDAYKGGSLRFLVCPRCGKTTVAMHNPKCPLCSTPREQFLTVN